MSKKKEHDKSAAGTDSRGSHHMAFTSDNYRWMLIGLGVIILGFILMAGKTDDLFDNGEIFRGGDVSFSTKMKVTVAPIVVLLGFCVEVYAILKSPKETDEPS